MRVHVCVYVSASVWHCVHNSIETNALHLQAARYTPTQCSHVSKRFFLNSRYYYRRATDITAFCRTENMHHAYLNLVDLFCHRHPVDMQWEISFTQLLTSVIGIRNSFYHSGFEFHQKNLLVRNEIHLSRANGQVEFRALHSVYCPLSDFVAFP